MRAVVLFLADSLPTNTFSLFFEHLMLSLQNISLYKSFSCVSMCFLLGIAAVGCVFCFVVTILEQQNRKIYKGYFLMDYVLKNPAGFLACRKCEAFSSIINSLYTKAKNGRTKTKKIKFFRRICK